MKFARIKLCIECDTVFELENQCLSCMCSSYIFPANILQIKERIAEEYKEKYSRQYIKTESLIDFNPKS